MSADKATDKEIAHYFKGVMSDMISPDSSTDYGRMLGFMETFSPMDKDIRYSPADTFQILKKTGISHLTNIPRPHADTVQIIKETLESMRKPGLDRFKPRLGETPPPEHEAAGASTELPGGGQPDFKWAGDSAVRDALDSAQAESQILSVKENELLELQAIENPSTAEKRSIARLTDEIAHQKEKVRKEHASAIKEIVTWKGLNWYDRMNENDASKLLLGDPVGEPPFLDFSKRWTPEAQGWDRGGDMDKLVRKFSTSWKRMAKRASGALKGNKNMPNIQGAYKELRYGVAELIGINMNNDISPRGFPKGDPTLNPHDLTTDQKRALDRRVASGTDVRNFLEKTTEGIRSGSEGDAKWKKWVWRGAVVLGMMAAFAWLVWKVIDLVEGFLCDIAKSESGCFWVDYHVKSGEGNLDQVTSWAETAGGAPSPAGSGAGDHINCDDYDVACGGCSSGSPTMKWKKYCCKASMSNGEYDADATVGGRHDCTGAANGKCTYKAKCKSPAGVLIDLFKYLSNLLDPGTWGAWIKKALIVLAWVAVGVVGVIALSYLIKFGVRSMKHHGENREDDGDDDRGGGHRHEGRGRSYEGGGYEGGGYEGRGRSYEGGGYEGGGYEGGGYEGADSQ